MFRDYIIHMHARASGYRQELLQTLRQH